MRHMRAMIRMHFGRGTSSLEPSISVWRQDVPSLTLRQRQPISRQRLMGLSLPPGRRKASPLDRTVLWPPRHLVG